MVKLFQRRGLRLSQSLGAFPTPEGDISPLYVFFDLSNTGPEPVELTRLYVTPKGRDLPVCEDDLKGERLPLTLRPGDGTRLQVRAKTLARRLKEAGYDGSPKVELAALDDSGERKSEVFRFRVEEYLALKDE